ncbi:MAG: nucleotidyl transferase AbiEii/AbiGii toxin family protein [Solirubrobacterales bacterium]
METLTRAQAIELFHIAFLDVFSRRVDVSRFVLKGGANLRYFFGSIRYSEDIDLDTRDLAPHLVHENVEAVLDSGPLPLLLRTRGIAVLEHTSPKLAETTQRWKVAIAAPGLPDPVRTRIEFSARDRDGEFELNPIPAGVVAPYALRPPSVQHYAGDTPAEQKILALKGRNETQARDVFDLDLLLRRRALPAVPLDPAILNGAASRAMELPYAAFRDQVIPFLEPDAVELYDSEEAWRQIQTFVAEALEAAR